MQSSSWHGVSTRTLEVATTHLEKLYRDASCGGVIPAADDTSDYRIDIGFGADIATEDGFYDLNKPVVRAPNEGMKNVRRNKAQNRARRKACRKSKQRNRR